MKLSLVYFPDGRLQGFNFSLDDETMKLLGEVCALRSELHILGEKIMASLDDVLNDVSGESTVIDSLVVLLQGIKTQLDAALSGTTLPPAVQAKVDAIFTQAEANKTKLADAVTANTPVAPPTPPTP